nr:unnamed protein product [Haemonchus contortus]
MWNKPIKARFYIWLVRDRIADIQMRLPILYTAVVVAALVEFSLAAKKEPKLTEDSNVVLAKIKSLRENAKQELQSIADKEERHLVETIIIEEQVKAFKASLRPKRDSTRAKKTNSKARRARKLRRARKVRNAAKRQAKRRAFNKRQARIRRARAQTRARLLRRIQRAKRLRLRSQRRAAEAKKADRLKKE